MTDTRAAAAPRRQPPAWARAVDLIAVALVVVAVIIEFSGGFRAHAGPLRLTVTSPLRTLLWAVALVIVRHLLAPEPPVYRDLPERLHWVRTPAIQIACVVLLGTRAAMFFSGYLAVFLFGYPNGRTPFRIAQNELINLPVRWDAGWYLQIASSGYRYVRDTGTAGQQNIVFFPAYPILTRAAGLLFGERAGSFVLGGTVVSLVAFLFALAYFFLLAREHLRDEDEARTATWLLAAYPFALFYGAVYTEALYLLAAVGAFYHLRRDEFRPAAMWGLVAGLTRPNGCFLTVPLAMVALARRRSPTAPASTAAGQNGPALRALAAAVAPGVGALVYTVYVWWLTGNPLAWVEGHAAWGRAYTGLGAVVVDPYEFIANTGLYAYAADRPIDLLNTLGVVFVLASAWPVARRFGAAYAVFILINMLPPLAAGGLLSAGRFSSVLFPAFLWAAAIIPRTHAPGWIASFAALQAFNAALFYTWRPLY